MKVNKFKQDEIMQKKDQLLDEIRKFPYKDIKQVAKDVEIPYMQFALWIGADADFRRKYFNLMDNAQGTKGP